MKKGFNLINKEVKRNINLLKLRKQIRSLVIGLVGVFIFLSLAVFIIFLVIKGSYQKNQKKIFSLQNEIRALGKTESLAIILADRIRGINTILNERKSYSAAITDIENLSVPGFEMEGLDLNNRGNLKITGTCDTRESLINYKEQVEQISQKDRYTSIIYPSFTRTKEGKYNIVLEMKP